MPRAVRVNVQFPRPSAARDAGHDGAKPKTSSTADLRMLAELEEARPGAAFMRLGDGICSVDNDYGFRTVEETVDSANPVMRRVCLRRDA